MYRYQIMRVKTLTNFFTEKRKLDPDTDQNSDSQEHKKRRVEEKPKQHWVCRVSPMLKSPRSPYRQCGVCGQTPCFFEGHHQATTIACHMALKDEDDRGVVDTKITREFIRSKWIEMAGFYEEEEDNIGDDYVENSGFACLEKALDILMGDDSRP